MMETVSSLHLPSWGLLSKFGFSDGDMPDDLCDWLEDRLGIEHARDMPWHTVLEALVREQLLPVIDQTVEVVSIETIHNPIRAVTVDGVDVTDFWYGDPGQPTLTPEGVTVSYETVLAKVLELR
jgi:hypothetical protein